jgi:hypothetical protein
LVVTEAAVRVKFFEYLFGTKSGYLCIATGKQGDEKQRGFRQHFFEWPKQQKDIASFVEAAKLRQNVWFCTSLLERTERKKEYCLPGNLVWADLDTCRPETVKPAPPRIIESSPRRFQALWRLDKEVEPYLQSDYSKRVAYTYAANGADPSGWDLTQLLRVPFTFNYKYEIEGEDVPEVKLLQSLEVKTPTALFEGLTQVITKEDHSPVPMPPTTDWPDVEQVLYKYYTTLSRTEFKEIYYRVPDAKDDWSKILWRLVNVCIEAGMENEEVLAVCWTAKCNKYARDNRPPFHLWQEVLRADYGQRKFTVIAGDKFQPFTMPKLVSDGIDLSGSFIEEYKSWAAVATDAIEEYHELSAAILLSSVIAGGLHLDTSYGEMVPNLWGMILGESTLTRKTTAMRMAMDIVADVDPEILLATDGSAEGLLTGLSGRPSQTSIFYKDEISGFLDSINRKDYLAGMPETLTQLYDVPRLYTRRLRKETITLSSPVFIFFGGGIKDRVYSLLTDEYILSGFLPRFLVVSGNTDLTRIRRTGPATTDTDEARANIVEKMRYLHGAYTGTVSIRLAGDQTTQISKKIRASLTDEAWQRYGDIEMQMVTAANESALAMYALPTFERLSRSLLKLSVLLAAARQDIGDASTLPVDTIDINHAAYYITKWGRHTVDLLHNSGKSAGERLIEKVLGVIKKHGEVPRSYIMQSAHLTKRQMDEVQGTLEDRGLIVKIPQGRGVRLKAL